MNGTASDSAWKVVKDEKSGRPYYYKAGSQETSWNKPDELLTPAQLATGWTETSVADGRIYWFKKDEKNKTSWEAPPGWHDAPEAPQFVSSSLQNYAPRDPPPRDSRPRDDYYRDRPNYDRRDDGGGYRGPLANTPGDNAYRTEAEAEAAFDKLLTKVGVQPDWSWEQAMRASIQDPAFRALKDPSMRKIAFEKFQDDMKIREKEREKERSTKLRNDFRTMLGRHPEIKHYTRWKTARPIIEEETIFRSTNSEEERKKLFREYVVELRQHYEEKRYHDHEDAMKTLASLLREVNLSPETRWEETHKRLQSHPGFINDEKYQTLNKSEVLDSFVAQVRRMWDDVNTIKQRDKQLEARKQRKAREGFLDLLGELQTSEKLKPTSTWKEIHPLVEDDPRYHALLDNVKTGDERMDGSTPLDFFFDTLEEFERELYEVRQQVDNTMKDMRFKFHPKTSLDEFLDVILRDERMAYYKKSRLEAVYKKLQQHAFEHEEDLARDEKRVQRKAIDALRSRIKRLEPPVELEDTWEQVRPRLERYDEYTTLYSDEERRAAYEKHMSRLQDDERDRVRRHERERTRDDRHSSRRERRRSRTPTRETDPYEADRRRAIEQRERQYRHTSNGGLSPPPRERRSRDDRYDRDDRDRRDRQSSLSRYDRERRERDAERERAYITRADPYAKASELDYGDSSDAPSRPQSSHGGKRAGSETDSRRVAKRARTERSTGAAAGERVVRNAGSETPAAAATDQQEEAPALQSGSEEGEIEEV